MDLTDQIFLVGSPYMDLTDQIFLVGSPSMDLTDQIFLVGSPYMDPESLHFWNKSLFMDPQSIHFWVPYEQGQLILCFPNPYFINRGVINGRYGLDIHSTELNILAFSIPFWKLVHLCKVA